jgi:hypothetical protein
MSDSESIDELVAELRRSSNEADYAAKVIDSSWALEVGIAANNLDRAADLIEALSQGQAVICGCCGQPWLLCPHPINEDEGEVSSRFQVVGADGLIVMESVGLCSDDLVEADRRWPDQAPHSARKVTRITYTHQDALD